VVDWWGLKGATPVFAEGGGDIVGIGGDDAVLALYGLESWGGAWEELLELCQDVTFSVVVLRCVGVWIGVLKGVKFLGDGVPRKL
jgi:hypothetical protein